MFFRSEKGSMLTVVDPTSLKLFLLLHLLQLQQAGFRSLLQLQLEDWHLHQLFTLFLLNPLLHLQNHYLYPIHKGMPYLEKQFWIVYDEGHTWFKPSLLREPVIAIKMFPFYSSRGKSKSRKFCKTIEYCLYFTSKRACFAVGRKWWAQN